MKNITTEDIGASIEAINSAIAMRETWGHLEPTPGRKYSGYILWTHGCHGDIAVINWKLEDLPGSPGFSYDLDEFIGQYNTEKGKIYRFIGSYKRFKNGKCRFYGNTFEVQTTT